MNYTIDDADLLNYQFIVPFKGTIVVVLAEDIKKIKDINILKIKNPDILFTKFKIVEDYKEAKCKNYIYYKKIFKEFESRLSDESKLLLEVL